MQHGGEEIKMTKTNKFKYFFLLMGKWSLAVIANTYLNGQGPWGTAVYGGVTLKPQKNTNCRTNNKTEDKEKGAGRGRRQHCSLKITQHLFGIISVALNDYGTLWRLQPYLVFRRMTIKYWMTVVHLNSLSTFRYIRDTHCIRNPLIP